MLPQLSSQVHFILNPDIQLMEDTLSDLAEWMAGTPRCGDGAAGAAIPGRPYPGAAAARCSLRAMVYRQLPMLKFWSKYNDAYLMADADLTQPTEIQFCTGSFSAVRTEDFRAVGRL